MESRLCNRCGQEKHISEFHKNGTDKVTGEQNYRLDCKVCYRAHRIANKKSFNKFANNTKHRTGEVDDVIDFKQWKACLVHFEGKCAYCGSEQTRTKHHTKEHVVPVAKSGTSSVGNIVPACKSCNCSKQDNDMEKWFRQQCFFTEAKLIRIKEWMALWQTQQ